ncbi:cyclase family protein [Rhodococcus sp. SGAir0479]|uniref:cyclase family protein n=1 Tax=Rhodococcus sp. SGAir0479 TaxID=2567884 RepID=UPI0010CCB5BC|nr:cyclase family protein [Rhodococcus sp. SGAir0479]QCQ92322.1 cyclase family protein [Rhodococcus sp. SGAir0479]
MCSPDVLARVHRTIGESAPAVSRRGLLGAAGLALAGAALAPRAAHAAAPRPSLPIEARSIVDLTHTLTPEFPVWPGNAPFAMDPVAVVDDGCGPLGSLAGSSGPPRGEFLVNRLAYWEHTGTHIDAPAHKIAGGSTVEELPVEDFVAPIAVVDIRDKARADVDAVLTVADLEAWEERHGRLPARALVAMNSGWDAHVGSPTYVGRDPRGTPHSPGFDPAAVTFLVEERDIVAIGVDTLSLDTASSRTYGAHVAALGAGKYGVESLANLGALPAVGATVVVGAPKHRGGSGGPCRVLAFV